MSVDAKMVKALRDKTGAGIIDCRNALVESNGDMESASALLLKKGLSSAGKKADRDALEGLVSIRVNGNDAAIIEVNSETDFVAKNADFQSLVNKLADGYMAFDGDDLEAFKESQIDGEKVSDIIAKNIATIGENIVLSRASKMHVDTGYIFSYIHGGIALNLGKIGVLLYVDTDLPEKKVDNIGKKLAMHVAAAAPLVVTADQLTDEQIAKRAETLGVSTSARDVINASAVLYDQIYIINGKSPVSEVLGNMNKHMDGYLKVADFILFNVADKKIDNEI